jgi:phosphate uptake regulator
MVWEFFKAGGDEQLEEIEALIVHMLDGCRHTFDLAINAVVGGTEAIAVGKEIRKSDRRVNKAERKIRRMLVVHVSVRGERADLPRVLVTTSIIKDVERVGDYAKNVWDLADAGIDLSHAEDIGRLVEIRDRTSQLISETSRIIRDRDAGSAESLLKDLDDVLDEYDDCIQAQIESTGTPRDAVPRALLCRYLKRISAHLMNVLTSLVMPFDRLDYYDEAKADRD